MRTSQYRGQNYNRDRYRSPSYERGRRRSSNLGIILEVIVIADQDQV